LHVSQSIYFIDLFDTKKLEIVVHEKLLKGYFETENFPSAFVLCWLENFLRKDSIIHEKKFSNFNI